LLTRKQPSSVIFHTVLHYQALFSKINYFLIISNAFMPISSKST